MTQDAVLPRAAGDEGPRRTPSPALGAVPPPLLGLLVLAALVLLGWQAYEAVRLTDGTVQIFTIEPARRSVLANVLAVVLVLGCALAPGRVRWLAIAGPAALLLGVLGATAILGGEFVAQAMALLTMAAAWLVGERALVALRATRLAERVLVAWLLGVAILSLIMTLIGRLDLIRWWTIALPVAVLGVVALVRLGRQAAAARGAIAQELSSPAGAMAAGGLMLLLTWTAIYTAAPEIQFDALYGKAYLPQLWAGSGEIAPLTEHAQLNVIGFFQLMAVPGHLVFDAVATGRWLQFVGLVAAPILFWTWGRRRGGLAGPAAALVVGLTPHLFWQATTADDDLLLALGGLGLLVAALTVLDIGAEDREFRTTAFTMGLLAGAVLSLKLHLAPLAATLLLAWIVAGRANGTAIRRLLFAAPGALITGGIPLAQRWIDTGNPVFPAYNQIFKSEYWPPINETFDFPFWPDAGTFGPIKAIWTAVGDPSKMVQASPPGSFGLLVGVLAWTVFLGWWRRDRRTLGLWVAVVVSLAYWYVSLRYLRYLLPLMLVSTGMLLQQLRFGTTTARAGRAFAVVAALATATAVPVALAQYWNVPYHKVPVSAAIGHWGEASYENAVFPERPAIEAFNANTPPGAQMVTSAHERVWLKGGRDLTAPFELQAKLSIDGPVPTEPDPMYARLRDLHIGWALVAPSDPVFSEGTPLGKLVAKYGVPAYYANGWALFRLTPPSAHRTPLPSCDPRLTGAPVDCWTGGLDRKPGLTTADNPNALVYRFAAVCPGSVLVAKVRQKAGGPPASVSLFFDQTGALGRSGVPLEPGKTMDISVAVPPGAKVGTVQVHAVPGATVQSVALEQAGPGCGR